MKAYVRKATDYRYAVYAGSPENHSKDSLVIGEYFTRRQAIRHATRNGYSVQIRGHDYIAEEQKKMKETLNIYVTASEYPDEKRTAGEWISLPADKRDIDLALVRMGVYGSEYGNDYFITDFESNIPTISRMPIEYIQRKGIENLNTLAEKLEKSDPSLINELNNALEEMAAMNNRSRPDRSSFFPRRPLTQYKAAHSMVNDGAVVPMEQMSFDSLAGTATNTRPVRNSNYDRFPTDEAEFKEVTDKLEKGIEQVFNSNKYKDYLNTLSKFHRYSFRNCLLISMQNPNATYVAGRKAWQHHFDRYVPHDEVSNSIKIFAPVPNVTVQEEQRKGQDGKPVYWSDGSPIVDMVATAMPKFILVDVYDISQTNGEPLHELEVKALAGKVENYNDLTAAIKRVSPVPINYHDTSKVSLPGSDGKSISGYYDHEDKQIVINTGMSEEQNLKTMIHELAHARLHDAELRGPIGALGILSDKQTREVQAESIAYTVCQHFGVDTSQYSFNYIALWSGDKEQKALKSSLNVIRNEAKDIIGEVDRHLIELQREKVAVVEQATIPEVQEQTKRTAKNSSNRKPTKTTTPKRTANLEKRGVRANLEAAKVKAAEHNANRAAKAKTKNTELGA